MADLRWLLLGAGVLVLLVIFWVSRREARGHRVMPTGFLRRGIPARSSATPDPLLAAENKNPAEQFEAERIITVRLMARGRGSFPGNDLVLALREAGLRHGQFGIFHRYHATDDSQVLFSVASLVEPGSFDLSQLKASRFPGISLFMTLPGPDDRVTAFDEMLSTARSLAQRLDGDLLDENGSRLSVQRERYLREEVIQHQHKPQMH